MLRDLLIIGVMLGCSRAMLWCVCRLDRGFAGTGEYSRKMLHVGMGLLLCPLPWLFDRPWPVVLLCGVYVGLLVARRFLVALDNHVGSVIDGVGRRSVGEFLFPIAVAIVFVLARGDRSAFVASMLVLTLADAAAAVVGRRYGLCHYASPGGCKSVEGSLAFATVAFASTHLTLLLLGGAGRVECVLIALIVALVTMMAEALVTGGWDNLVLPIGTFGILKLTSGLGVGGLAGASAGTLTTSLAMVGILAIRSWVGREARTA